MGAGAGYLYILSGAPLGRRPGRHAPGSARERATEKIFSIITGRRMRGPGITPAGKAINFSHRSDQRKSKSGGSRGICKTRRVSL